MTSKTTKTTAGEQAIATILAALEETLGTAHALATEAAGYMDAGNRNAAVGTILGLQQLLTDAQAIQTTAIALHRRIG